MCGTRRAPPNHPAGRRAKRIRVARRGKPADHRGAVDFASAALLATAPRSAHICPPRRHTMKAEYVEKQKEYEAKKARAKALALRLTCTICGAKPKTLLNCPCGTTQCVHPLGGGARARRDATQQVLLDGLSTHRLARPGPPEGVQEDPSRARGGGGPGRGTDAPAGRGLLRPRAVVARRRGPRAHRRGARGGPRAARGEPGAGAAVGAVWVAVPGLLRGLGRECDDPGSHLLLPEGLPIVRGQDRLRRLSPLSSTLRRNRRGGPRASSPPCGERGAGGDYIFGRLLRRWRP